MSTVRGKQRSTASPKPKRSAADAVEPTPAPTFVEASVRQRKPAVLHAMPSIRWLMTMHRFEVEAYSDEALADALLETCPRPDDFWLRTEHLSLAVQHVTAEHARPRRP